MSICNGRVAHMYFFADRPSTAAEEARKWLLDCLPHEETDIHCASHMVIVRNVEALHQDGYLGFLRDNDLLWKNHPSIQEVPGYDSNAHVGAAG